VSTNLAVWEGPVPSSRDKAVGTFDEMYERYVESNDKTPPTDRIASYVSALLARYPEPTEHDADDAFDACPWADGPMIGNAIGPFMYFGVINNEAGGDACSFAIDTAHSLGLICFDPQSGQLVDVAPAAPPRRRKGRAWPWKRA